ncbi:hypothetical protein O0L34_g18979 [Tuta absoluta]|nr:hypothetical protein O0L34_g18979 [Tuta absoluta]
MSVKIALEKQPILNIVCAYAPQTNTASDEKDAFWDDLHLLTNNIPKDESVHLGADLNGHVGESNNNAGGCHGGYGYGTRNQDGDRILEYAVSCDLAIINTYFSKKDTHLITYRSGGRSTQIDFVLARRKDLGKYKDSKVIPGEALTSQHRILVTVYKLSKPIKLNQNLIPKIKWRSLKSDAGTNFILELKDLISKTCEDCNSTANEMWEDFELACVTLAEKHLGRTKKRKGPFKETSWWQGLFRHTEKRKRFCYFPS